MGEASTNSFTSLSKNRYIYGYDLLSESVCNYPAVHDIRVARNALINNVHDYLLYTNAFESRKSYDTKRLGAYLLLAVAILLVFVLFFFKEALKPYTWTTYAMIICSLVCLGIACLYDLLNSIDGVAFDGVCTGFSGCDVNKKSCLSTLKGRRLRISVNEVSNTPKLIIEAQLVGSSRLFASSCIYYSVSKEVPYGTYFSREGFFYPPSMVGDIEMLLKKLASNIKKKQ